MFKITLIITFQSYTTCYTKPTFADSLKVISMQEISKKRVSFQFV